MDSIPISATFILKIQNQKLEFCLKIFLVADQ